MTKLKIFLAVLAMMVSSWAHAQNLTVTGTVKDSSTGEPVPFAAIQLKGTMTGGMTDMDGIFAFIISILPIELALFERFRQLLWKP